MSTLFILFCEFFYTGLLAVGGGLATLPFLAGMAERYPAWFAAPTLPDIVAIAESTPGPIGVNAATFIGFNAAGPTGAVVATLALTLPSYIIICVIARFLEKYRDSALVESAFSGLRPAVTGLIAAAAYSMLRAALLPGGGAGFLAGFDWRCAALFAVFLVCLFLPKLSKLHPIFYIIAGAAAGVAIGL